MTIETTPLNRAIEIAGGITAFSKALGLSSHSVANQWRRNRVPAERCPDIEALTGVRCEELRYDVNWWVLRISEIGRDPNAPAQTGAGQGT